MLAKAKTVAPQSFGVRILTDIRGLIFGTGKEIHYIGGTEILPPPLGKRRECEEDTDRAQSPVGRLYRKEVR